MNERIAAVWCIVSVPCPMMMPLAPRSISRPTASAVPIHCAGPMFSLKTP